MTDPVDPLREAARYALALCDCPNDWSADDSHHRDCLQSTREMAALRAALDEKPS